VAEFRGEVREFLVGAMAPARTRGHEDRRDLTGWDDAFERSVLRESGAAGFLGVSLPEEDGGGGRPPSWQAVVAFEAAYHDAPLIDTAAALVAPPVVAFGNEAQRAELVPAACAGTVNACIAYTEAGAGSDLSNITALATPDGEGFVLTGEKVLVTGAHKADWCCTIARTDPASSGRHGLSMFLVPMATDGLEVTRHATANRWTLSTIRFADAAVDRGAVLGQVDGGWKQLTGALLGERSGSAWMGWATRNVEALLVHCEGTTDPVLRGELADLVTHWFGALRQMERVLALQDAGVAPVVEGAMSKVYATELLQRIARVGGRALGAGVLTAPGWFGGPMPGWFSYELVERLHPTLSVGANEIQRTTIANVGLGLPPEPRA
jgi:alkylation response protein AidB-like acyl-CoA dehydrogenase